MSEKREDGAAKDCRDKEGVAKQTKPGGGEGEANRAPGGATEIIFLEEEETTKEKMRFQRLDLDIDDDLVEQFAVEHQPQLVRDQLWRFRTDYVLIHELDDNLGLLRDKFEEYLVNHGLILKKQFPKAPWRGRAVVAVHIHAPWTTLARRAELKNMRMPLKITRPSEDLNLATYHRKFFQKIASVFCLVMSSKDNLLDTYTGPFRRDMLEMFDIREREHFFTSSERSFLVHDILVKAGKREEDGRDNLHFLRRRGAYVDAFALHDGSLNAVDRNDRLLLWRSWTGITSWFRPQPLHLVRTYCGDETALYYAWFGFLLLRHHRTPTQAS